jgi:hypothetical protein
MRNIAMTTVIKYRPDGTREKSAYARDLSKTTTLSRFWRAIDNGLSRAFGALFDAMEESRQKQAQRFIERYAASQGDHMTDELEREIMCRL